MQYSGTKVQTLQYTTEIGIRGSFSFYYDAASSLSSSPPSF